MVTTNQPIMWWEMKDLFKVTGCRNLALGSIDSFKWMWLWQLGGGGFNQGFLETSRVCFLHFLVTTEPRLQHVCTLYPLLFMHTRGGTVGPSTLYASKITDYAILRCCYSLLLCHWISPIIPARCSHWETNIRDITYTVTWKMTDCM